MSPTWSQHQKDSPQDQLSIVFDPSCPSPLTTPLPVRNLQGTRGSKGALEEQASRSWAPLGDASPPVSSLGIRLPWGSSSP